MERLTELHYKKSDGYYTRCSEHCNDICDCNCEKWGEIVDRLGAYEDTGLEPEEIEKNKQDVEAGYLKVTARRYGIDVSRLRELVEADREGRCVVLPCMIGDTVYVLNHHLGRVFENEVAGFSVGYQSDNRNSVSTVYVGKYGSKTFRRWKFQQFRKTVFLTREEAEAALKEAEE